tara:strand:+ start:275 stop:415 length:141 start_codon:yes stop_codon:yes gene_type:complete
MQSYADATGLSSVEQASLFPAIANENEFLYLAGASFEQVTSYSHHQ